jgi:hypothetical protein
MGFKYLTSEREKDKKPAAPRRVACINESNRIELIAWAYCLSFFLVIAYLLMVIFGGGVALNDSGDISAVIYTYLTISGRVRANQFGRSLPNYKSSFSTIDSCRIFGLRVVWIVWCRREWCA